MARPIGDVALALLQASADGPATVRELAAQSQVAYAVARYTVSRLVHRGLLVREDSVRQRSCRFMRPVLDAAAPAVDLTAAVAAWNCGSFVDGASQASALVEA
jgi:predicted transcriptional regulator